MDETKISSHECGCEIIAFDPFDPDSYVISYCPKHAAAPAMFEALRPFAKLAEAITRRGYSDSSRIVSLAGTSFKKEYVLLGRDFFEAQAALELAGDSDETK